MRDPNRVTEPPHRPDTERAFALLTAWRSNAPDPERPEDFSTDGLTQMFNFVGDGADPWNVILGLVAIANYLLINVAEAIELDSDGLLATIAQMAAERRQG